MTTTERIQAQVEHDDSRLAQFFWLKAAALEAMARGYEIEAEAAQFMPEVADRARMAEANRGHAKTYRDCAESYRRMAEERTDRDLAAKVPEAA